MNASGNTAALLGTLLARDGELCTVLPFLIHLQAGTISLLQKCEYLLLGNTFFFQPETRTECVTQLECLKRN